MSWNPQDSMIDGEDWAESFPGLMIDRAEAVLTGRTPAEDRIFVARTWPVKPDDLPFGKGALLIFFHEEDQTLKGETAPPTFLSAPQIVIEGIMRGDDAKDLHRALDRFRQLVINLIMRTPAFLSEPLEKVTQVRSMLVEKSEQFQYHRFQTVFTLRTTEAYQPGPFPDLELVRVEIDDVKGRPVAGFDLKPD